MTTAVKEKKPFLPQRKAQPQAGGGVAVRAGAPVRPAANATFLSIGGEPRVHLLPKEVVDRKDLKRVKRRLLTAGVAVVVIVGIAYAAVTFELTSAQGQLSAVQATTTQLLTQQSKYSQVTKVQSDMAAITAAQQSTTTQEIMWQTVLHEAESTLPAGATVTGADASIDNPLSASAGGGVPAQTTLSPLQGPRIATVTLTVSIAQGDIPHWLNTLPTAIKGFVDATPGSVTAPTTSTTNYQLVVTIHLNADAISNRFPSGTATPAPTGGNN